MLAIPNVAFSLTNSVQVYLYFAKDVSNVASKEFFVTMFVQHVLYSHEKKFVILIFPFSCISQPLLVRSVTYTDYILFTFLLQKFCRLVVEIVSV